jgi:hypothetical protein
MNYVGDARNSVVVTEAFLALAVTLCTWLMRRRMPWVFLLFPVMGAAWMALAHGLAFYSDGNDAGMLAGFGVASALFIGLPVGSIAGGAALVWWLSARRPSEDKRVAETPDDV